MNGDIRKEVIIMTAEEKTMFDKGVQWVFDSLAERINEKWSHECKSKEEIRDFAFDIWSWIDGFEYGIHYKELEEYYEKHHISKEEQDFFEDGIRTHRAYVKYCMLNHENTWTELENDVKKYFAKEITFIPNAYYSNFEDFTKTN